MLYFEVESDRDVTVDAIGLLEAGVPVVVSDETIALFKVIHDDDLIHANFPSFVKVTAVLKTEPAEEEVK